MTMKTYDPAATCPKCGGTDVSALWQDRDVARGYQWDPMPVEEHLRRRCQRCAYEWPEAPLDATEAAQ
ncbi:hypothetical protein EYW49_20085 [Siculibacillus lacustris]|uniref:Uncharacterized protein n=1 Tax=Siculibacillus lacustris TaxID=1549641 RepID=A0A4Q9VFK9_9HYPH|nr:hypothetical protein [Siculibacillus lacustris]TBW33583.1 hypothetical protein EYW49_20085 [Siculibacillus lacustris]